MITRDDLMAVCPRPKNGARRQIWDSYADAMLSRQGQALFKQYRVYTPARMAMFLGAVVAPETGMTVLRESGAYSYSGILRIFGAGRHSSRITETEARRIAALPVNADGSGPRCDALFERAYGLGIAHCCKRVKNCLTPKRACQARSLGNWEPGDGARCRGLGLNQQTGRGAQEKSAKEIGCTLDELATPIHALEMALIEWDEKNCNKWADRGGNEGVIAVRKLINAGSLKVATKNVNGIPEARRAYEVARRVVTAEDFADVEVAADDDDARTAEPLGLYDPPKSIAHSTEAQVATTTGLGGAGVMGNAMQNAVMNAAQTGDLSLWNVFVQLLASPQFWIGAGFVFAGAYMLGARIKRYVLEGH